MSSILDALERASRERQPGKVDILPQMVPVADDRKAKTGVLTLLVLVLISLAVALWLVLRNGTEEAGQAPRIQRQAPQATPSHTPVARLPQGEMEKTVPRRLPPAERIRSSSSPNQQPLVTEARLDEERVRKIPQVPGPVAARQAPSMQQRAQHGDQPAVPSVAIERISPALEAVAKPGRLPAAQPLRQSPAVSETDEAGMVRDDPAQDSGDAGGQPRQPQIPLIWELDQGLREELEQLKISIHVYHQEPAQRFVIINMHRYSEGESLGTTGFRLHEINREGIIVDYGDGLVRLLRE